MYVIMSSRFQQIKKKLNKSEEKKEKNNIVCATLLKYTDLLNMIES